MRWASASCCRRPSCSFSSPIRSGSASGSASPTPGSAAPASSSACENYEYLWNDGVFWLSVFNTLLYTISASILKFVLGLWLALLLNENLPFKSFFRAIVLLPWVVPTVLSAIAFWWIYDSQFSILSWALDAAGPDRPPHQFPRRPETRAPRSSRPMSGAAFLSSPSRCSPACRPYRSRSTRPPRSTAPAAGNCFRYVTLPLLTPIIAITMTFSVLFTFTDFQLIYVLTRGGPVNATHLMATLSFQRGISGGQLGEGAAIAVAMIPFLLAAILFSYFGLQRRKWQQGGGD